MIVSLYEPLLTLHSGEQAATSSSQFLSTCQKRSIRESLALKGWPRLDWGLV